LEKEKNETENTPTTHTFFDCQPVRKAVVRWTDFAKKIV